MACRPYHILFFIPLLGLAGAGQSSSSSFIGAVNLHQRVLDLPQSDDLAFAVSVSDDKTIAEISSSVVNAETWLRTLVLSRYPSARITAVVVFVPGFCQTPQQEEHNSVRCLLSLKNIYHSLVRWGLEKDIKVSSGFSYQCLNTDKTNEEVIESLAPFLRSVNSTFTINTPRNFPSSPDHHLFMLRSMKKFQSLGFYKVNFINPEPEDAESIVIKRKLRSFVDISRETVNPLPEISPIHPSIGFSAPASVARNPIPHPPLSSAAAGPTLLPPQAYNPPVSAPGYSLPPCAPPGRFTAVVPPPKNAVEGLWCVAKPSVAEETLQQALDFACGEGGADCDEIRSHGSCFYPDTVVAHASYAFNSYWQKTKRNGGTCSFGGTAILITADPSYMHCRFILS
ncbi:PREDICTED: glucan endo-1,3-beta-glucosidase 4-like [Tarenaya hassleriana]|uniref:glucan endo-1,3-beta-glucosidase 4-like n=1 Tax=Tarenaya hassleriana TaxID=28532 RepID=UPI00053CA256|nr:PREDICTED: glucan endo-1,3-beta-glucosidase 4-like [Tarenaya hassleriana]